MPKLTIKGAIFDYTAPYEAGHVLDADEASTLNQVRGENLRNNFAGEILTAFDNFRKAHSIPESEDVKFESLPADVQAQLASDFADYDKEYKFGARRGRIIDPVEAEAVRIGREKVRQALIAKGIKVSDLKTADFDALVQRHWAQHGEGWTAAARAAIEARKNAGGDGLDVSLEGLVPTGANGSAADQPGA